MLAVNSNYLSEKTLSLIHTMFSVTYELKYYITRNVSNYTNQMRYIYSLLTVSATCFGVTYTNIRENFCAV
jgi:hypothetical protein